MEYIQLAAAAAALLTTLMPTILALIDEIAKMIAAGQTPPPAKLAELSALQKAMAAASDFQTHIGSASAAKAA